MEIIFLIGFVMVLLVTGVSILGVLLALAVAALFMLLGGVFAVVIKLFPWLVLAAIGVALWRGYHKPAPRRY